MTRSQLNGPDGQVVFNFEGDERYILQRRRRAQGGEQRAIRNIGETGGRRR